jgi:hypothetical protein
MMDPGLTAMLVLGDGETTMLGQYLWPDPAARGPGFRLDLGEGALAVQGPLSLDEVRQSLLEALSLDSAAAAAEVRLTLDNDEFFALAALVDAYVSDSARRRLSRLPGPPSGLTAADAVKAWLAGLGGADPSWSVTLFAMLNPDAVPADFDRRLPEVMRRMADEGLLAVLEDEEAEPMGDMYVIGEGLDMLYRSLAAAGTNFGMAVQRRLGPDKVEAAILGGWRTSGGIWLADVSSLPEGEANLTALSPELARGLLETVLAAGEEAAGEGAAATRQQDTDTIIEQLKAATAGAAARTAEEGAAATPSQETEGRAAGAPPRFCRNCGKELSPGAAFCRHCGTAASGS